MNGVDLWTIAAALWIAVTIAALAGGTWLAVTLARLDRRARQALEQLLASGEIDIEDYRRRMALIGH